ncbi:DoxX family protein [Frankia sp. Mgl5]|uniref:DoxX family protein n=1 Tax=Frankiaceae TaxID=74712 RepID=UPI0003661874|nr:MULTISPECIES: DoxX family protein [Frankiaceae]MCK9928972.1 DoxX family protein [Frankia sp. Mgl5]
MNVFLWIVQGLLAAAFAVAGVLKSTRSREQLIPQLPWVSDVSTPVVRLIGAVEFAGALGLILPGAFDIATVLTPLAATGLAVIMVLAMGLHARRKEPAAIAFNAVLLILAAVVMWGRFGPHAL